MKQRLLQKVPTIISLLFLGFLSGCQSDQASSSGQASETTLVDNVKAIEKEDQMEQTEGDYLDQSTLADPHPSQN